MSQAYNEQMKFYRVVKEFIEGGNPVKRNVGHDLKKSSVAFDNLWESLGVYYKAREGGKARGLSVLELSVIPVKEVSDEFSHYVIEFEALPQYMPRVKYEYRARSDVEDAIGKSSDFAKTVKIYGVELETKLRPEPRIPQRKKPKK